MAATLEAARLAVIFAALWISWLAVHATLIILKFPRGYKAALTAISKLWPPF